MLGLAGVMMAAALMSPALAVRLATTGYVKAKINQAKNELSGRIGGLEGRVGNVEGLNNLQFIRSSDVTVPDGGFGQAQAVCPSGTSATGGGGVSTSVDGFQVDSYPTSGAAFSPGAFIQQGRSAWGFEWINFSGFTQEISAYVVCLAVDATGGNYTPGTIPFKTGSREA